MVHKYIIKDILHSGTKGDRGSPVTDEKYDGMIGSIVFFDPSEIKFNQSFDFYFKYHPYYNFWTISYVKEIAYDTEKRNLIIESENSIYIFEDMGEYRFVRDTINPDLVRGVAVCV